MSDVNIVRLLGRGGKPPDTRSVSIPVIPAFDVWNTAIVGNKKLKYSWIEMNTGLGVNYRFTYTMTAGINRC